jgi:hypothetical protein
VKRLRLVLVVALSPLFAVSACGTSAPRAHRIADVPAADASDPVIAVSAPAPAVQAEVLAAYYRARTVDEKAYLELDASQLASVYARDALDGRLDEIDRRKRESRPMRIRMEFHPHVTMLGAALAAVDDDVQNHSVRLDAATRQPVEPDPNELLQDTFTLERLEGRWLVVMTARVAS